MSTRLDPIEIIRDEARAAAMSLGVTVADELASSLVERIQERLAGVPVYIAARSSQQREQLHAYIRGHFNGSNVNELARETGLSPRSVRRILNLTRN
jgi:Mor family transcriptional regulator